MNAAGSRLTPTDTAAENAAAAWSALAAPMDTDADAADAAPVSTAEYHAGWTRLEPNEAERLGALAAVTFTATAADIRAFQRFARTRGWLDHVGTAAAVLVVTAALLFVGGVLLMLTEESYAPRLRWLAYVPAALAPLIALVLLQFAYRKNEERGWRKTRQFVPRTVRLTPEFLVCAAAESGRVATAIPWAHLKERRARGGRLLLRFAGESDGGPDTGVVVPERAFGTPEEARAFYDAAGRLADAAQEAEKRRQGR